MIACIWSLLLALLLGAASAHGKTLVVAGRLSSEVTVAQEVAFGVDGRLTELTYRFPVPARVTVPSTSQRLIDQQLSFHPPPLFVEDETDRYGNRYEVVTWRDLTGDARASVVFTAALDAPLAPSRLLAALPPARPPRRDPALPEAVENGPERGGCDTGWCCAAAARRS